MKNQIKKKHPISFLVVLLLSLVLTSQLFSIYANRLKGIGLGDREKALIALSKESPNTIDVLVLGDSESFTSIEPMKIWADMGIPLYNAGNASATMFDAFTSFQKALSSQEPKLIILETNCLFMGHGRSENMRALLRKKIGAHFSIFDYHNIWKNIYSKNNSNSWNRKKGFLFDNDVNACKDLSNYMKPTNNIEHIPLSNLLFLRLLQKECASKNIPLLLYSCPSPKNYTMKKHNALMEISKKFNIRYIDLNTQRDKPNINWNTDTFDRGDHLNISGAEKVTAYMEKQLLLYKLPDRRGSLAYSSWSNLAPTIINQSNTAIIQIRQKNLIEY